MIPDPADYVCTYVFTLLISLADIIYSCACLEYFLLTVALEVYTRSPTAYDALKGFGILDLPSVSTLKTFTSFNVESAGVSEERLAFARRQYDAMVDENHATHQSVPFNEGVLVFDEVKVGLKVHYHAKSGNTQCLQMS